MNYASFRYQDSDNIWNNYNKISSGFCKYYYHLWDQNFPSIINLYSNNAKIYFLNRNVTNVHGLSNCIRIEGIWKFDHLSIYGTSQLLDCDTILINVFGNISINCVPYHQKFTETLIIKRNMWNKWFIINSIFRIIPDSPF